MTKVDHAIEQTAGLLEETHAAVLRAEVLRLRKELARHNAGGYGDIPFAGVEYKQSPLVAARHDLSGLIRAAKDLKVAVDPLYLSALILVRGILFEHVSTEGGIPVTDVLAGAMERIEAHEAALVANKEAP